MELKDIDDDYEHTISQKPKYMDNIWKILLFLYASIIQAVAISLSLLDTNASIIQDLFMFFLYMFASGIILTMMIYFHINRRQTFEEANKVNHRAHKLCYSMHGEKVGLYLRFGLILIGLFSLTYVCLVNARIVNTKIECINTCLIISTSSQALFFILQVIFILKYHSIIILRHNQLIRFGLFNLILMNVITWEIVCMSKISYMGNFIVSNPNCTIKNLDSLHLYFLPAVAEYSVIGMAIIFEILKRIGKSSLIETLPEIGSTNFIEGTKNSIPGCVLGVGIVISCISYTIFIILSDTVLHAWWVFYAHNGEEMCLYVFSIIILAIAFSKSQKLKFSFTFLQNNIDRNLLEVSGFLSLVFSTLISIYCFTFLTDSIRLVRGVTALLEIVQIVLQTIVIQDSFYRCSNTNKQHHEKPGQNYFAILTGCNFGMWLLKSFQLKNGDIFFNKYQSVIQNNVIFSFFLYATMPLSVLYRYHSSCCFAGAFSKIYEEESDRFEGMMRSEGFDKHIRNEKKRAKYQMQLSLDPKIPNTAPRRRSLPNILLNNHIPKNAIPNNALRRPTIKHLETAKLRVLSSQLSHNMIRNKLSPTFSNNSDLSINLEDNQIMNNFNLMMTKKYPLLRRHSSNPLDISSPITFLFTDQTGSENTKANEYEDKIDFRSKEELNSDDKKTLEKTTKL